jgi:hypothetical protein
VLAIADSRSTGGGYWLKLIAVLAAAKVAAVDVVTAVALYGYRSSAGSSHRPDILRARSFRAATFFVAHLLTDAERFDTHSLQRGVMEEQIATFSLDEPETFVSNQLFDGALGHTTTPFRKQKNINPDRHLFTKSRFPPRKIVVES